MREFNHAELTQLQFEIGGGYERDEKGGRGKRVMDGILNIRISGISQRTKVSIRERSKDISRLLESISDSYKTIIEKKEENVKALRQKYYENPEEKERTKLLLKEGMNESDLKEEIKNLQEQVDKDVEELENAKHKVEKIDGLDVGILEDIDCGVTGDFYGILIELQKS